MWEHRRRADDDGDVFKSQWLKGLMVGLYGKFGQRSHPWEEDFSGGSNGPQSVWWRTNADTQTLEVRRDFFGGVELQGLPQEGFDSFPAISSLVAAHARHWMDGLRELAGARHVYWQYIDSLIVDADGRERLSLAGKIHPTDLGQLKSVDESDGAEFFAPGHYVWKDKEILCGAAAGWTHTRSGKVSCQEVEGTHNQIESGR